jgi:tight adherence protein B
MDSTLLPLLIGAAVVGLTICLFLAFSKPPAAAAEKRLDQLAGRAPRSSAASPDQTMLLRPDRLNLGTARAWMPSSEAIEQLFEQADIGMDFRRFLFIPLGLAVAGAVGALVAGLPPAAAAGASIALTLLPVVWLFHRKKKRIKQFVAQMPDALELVSRALRAGHSLGSGLHVVADEMAPPIAVEFGRIFEEQNLGIPIEDALRGLASRVPTMDVRFFVTAVIIQRTTGGDLAEILDKIGRLIRERFQILGQVQALTAEGRLSGIVLLALPPALLVGTYFLNPEYVSVLFNTAQGTKLLAGAAVLQILGAVAIKKIITIKI